MTANQLDLAEARRIGRLEADAFAAKLTAVELGDRELRLAQLAAGGTDLELPPESDSTWRLWQENARLSAFYHAVHGSRAWRLAQWLRRPLGRAW